MRSRDLRWNSSWIALTGALFEAGATFIDTSVVALFVTRLTRSATAVGATEAIARVGWLLPQLVAAHYAQVEVVRLRRAEQLAAAQILGVQRVTFLDFEDGELGWGARRLAEEITRLIRQNRPEIVLTHDPFAGAPHYAQYQLHPDHRAVGFAAIDAVYFRAPGPLYYPEHRAAGLGPHRASEIWLMMGDHHDEFVDITATFERKVNAVRAHASQWGKHPDLAGFLRRRAERLGQNHEIPLGEAFKRLVPT